jgi:hypothetical protein
MKVRIAIEVDISYDDEREMNETEKRKLAESAEEGVVNAILSTENNFGFNHPLSKETCMGWDYSEVLSYS